MNDELQELIQKVLQWGHDRNLTDPNNLTAQTLKLVSEAGEIALGLLKADSNAIEDGVGDTMVVAIIIAHQIGAQLFSSDLSNGYEDAGSLAFESLMNEIGQFADMVLKGHSNGDKYQQLIRVVDALGNVNDRYLHAGVHQALSVAYDTIKDRKGVMYGGAFIKESDPRFPAVMRELRRAT